MTDLILQMATAFLNQDDPDGDSVADSIELDGDEYLIRYSYRNGSSEWRVSQLELLAFIWSSK